ncbi:MAG: hypothetical protein COA44_02595 [Arcobacter sp.]|nr:MAG: hypothetical protein COA44_02595 [Arcobacter sp.]
MSKKKILIFILSFVFTIIVSFSVGYMVALVDTATPYTHKRPSIVPKTALWIGGLDGGNYIEIEKLIDDPINVYQAKIYYDYEICELRYSGKLELNSLEKIFNYKNPDIFSSFDGVKLNLQDGRYLSIVK